LKEERAAKTQNKVKYDSCRVLAIDGKQLFNCDERKAFWYVKRGFAQLIQETPHVIVQFNFVDEKASSKFAGIEEIYNDEFYSLDRVNECLICGADKEFARFQTVPHLYRLNFPHTLKAHTSNDVLLLCRICHERAVKHQDLLKEQLSIRYKFPLDEMST
jgi:hypothetical protein